MHLSLAYSNSVGFNNNLSIDPSATIQYRFYYNALHRKFKGKTTELNNLNYMAVIFKTDLSTRQILFSNRQEYLMDFVTDNKRRLVNQAGIVIGMQRNYKGHLSLDLNIGPAYLFTKQAINMAGQPTTVNVSSITFMGQLTLGFWLNRKS